MEHEIKKFSKFDVALETGGQIDKLAMRIEQLRKEFNPELTMDLMAIHGIDLERILREQAMREIT